MREDTRTGGHEGRIGQLEAWRLRGLVDQKAATIQVAGGGPRWRVAGDIFRSRVSVVQVSGAGLRSRRSGIGFGPSGSGTGAGPEPVPDAEYLNPGPDGRDPGPEKGRADGVRHVQNSERSQTPLRGG